jgi:uncharacterized membrane protein (Fun14 family)
MSLPQSQKESVPVELIEYSKSIFDRYASDFDHLDNKSIGIMGVVGLLVGFQALNLENLVYIVLAVAKRQMLWLAYITIIALLFHLISIILSLCRALSAFQVKSIEYPTDVVDLVTKFRKDQSENRVDHLKVDIVKTYANSIDSLYKGCTIKAKNLKQSVFAIFVAVISLVVYIALLLIHKSL